MLDYLLYLVLPQCIHGLVWGMCIALIAIGLTIVFGLMDVVNFAHGELYMIGAFLGYTLLQLIPNFWVVLVIAALFGGIFSLFIEVSIFRPLYGRSPIFYLLLTFGLSMILKEAARLVWGPITKRIEAPVTYSIDFLGITYPVFRLIILAIALVVLISLWYIINRTDGGMIMRAVSQDRTMSAALGIRILVVNSFAFGGGAVLAALSGFLMAPINFVYPTMGSDIILRAFIVVIIGGLGNIKGTILASIFLAEVESLGSLWISPTLAETMTFVMLIIIVSIRPQGLFGSSQG